MFDRPPRCLPFAASRREQPLAATQQPAQSLDVKAEATRVVVASWGLLPLIPSQRVCLDRHWSRQPPDWLKVPADSRQRLIVVLRNLDCFVVNFDRTS